MTHVQQQYHHHEHQYTSYTNYSFDGNTHSTPNQSSSYLTNGEQYAGRGNDGPVSADHTIDTESSIMQSVKEQEAQFERLTRELEEERRSVADQLDHYNKRGSMAGSMRSLNSVTAPSNGTNGHLSTSYQQYQYDEEQFISEADGYTAGTAGNESSHLIDSCLNDRQNGTHVMTNQPGASTDEGAAYVNGGYGQYYDDNYSEGQSSSRYNSYRQPQGNHGMTRSQANYALNDAAADTNDGDLIDRHDEQQFTQLTDWDRYPQSTQSHISEGDYIPASVASRYLNDTPQQSGQPFSDHQYTNSDYYNQSGADNQPTADLRTNSYREQAPPVHRASSRDQINDYRRNPSYSYSGNHDLSEGPNNIPAATSPVEEDQRFNSYNQNYMARDMPDRSGTMDHNYPDQYQPDNAYAGNDAPQPNSRELYGSRRSLDSRLEGGWRKPDLPEVIEYLSHPNDAVKANAAAYLQHLCYNDVRVKERTRELRGIPALVNLLSSDIPELNRNALGALLNLSRGYENDDNKRAIKTCGGIEALATLLARTRDNDVRELISGILWNISSLGELKRSVISAAVPTLVKYVIAPASGLTAVPNSRSNSPAQVTWSTEFRNATGVIRNVSSANVEARTCLRQCDGLIDSLLNVVRVVIGKAEMDNKPVENVVCSLRNLSFRLMEVDYPDYYLKQAREHEDKTQQKRSVVDEMAPTCFGKSGKPVKSTTEYPSRTTVGSGKGEQLWQLDVADIYLPLLSDCSNTDTLEAAVGAIQNLTACAWQPSSEFREHIRKRKGLPVIVELLGLEEADNVVCGAAIALRNLAQDKSNKTLIGKYAISQLVSRLPSITSSTLERCKSSEDTIRAVVATLHEVFKDKDKDSAEHASTLVNDTDGLTRLMTIAKSKRKYTVRTLRAVHTLLTALWKFSSLRDQYKSKGYKESDFLSKTMHPRAGGDNAGAISIASTLTRSRSELPSNTNTLNTISRGGNAYRDHQQSDYPTADTLPIQRPLYQPPSDDMYYPRDAAHPNHSYNASSYPNTFDNWQQNNNTAYNQSAASAGPGPGHVDSDPQGQSSYRYNNGSVDYPEASAHQYPQHQQNHQNQYATEADYGQRNGEPLYARVQKRRSNNDLVDHSFVNNAYQQGNSRSMESLQMQMEQNHIDDARADNPNNIDVDSWV